MRATKVLIRGESSRAVPRSISARSTTAIANSHETVANSHAADGVPGRRHPEAASRLLAQPQVEGLRTFLAGACFELHFQALTQVLEVDLRCQPRAMEENLVAAVVRIDEAETLVLDYLFDRTVHRTSSAIMKTRAVTLSAA